MLRSRDGADEGHSRHQHSWRHKAEAYREEQLARARRRAQQGLPKITYPLPVQSKDKIVYLVLFGLPENLHVKRTPWLVKSVKQLGENVLPWTPIHVVVWYQLPLPKNATDLMHDYVDGNIDFIQLSREEWLEGASASPPAHACVDGWMRGWMGGWGKASSACPRHS